MTMDLAANFEELMQRSPIPQHEMKTFLKEMRRTSSGTVTVSKLLAAKIQSTSEAQAIHAFEFLEAALESETEGSIEFRTEIGRYRFLNEIIRILSPKYLGDKTPEAVKERAIQFLEDASGPKRKRWFPSEHSKVNSVYQSLVDGGIIQKPSKVADEDAEFQKSIFERGENAVILKRLLQSRDPSDLQAANRLIKNLVDEEARRNERRAELHSLIDRIETSTGLLTEMLTQPNIDKEIVEELVDTCRSLRQKLGGVATETNDETTSLLQASENIETVLLLYDSKKEYIGKLSKQTNETASASSSTACSSSAGAAGSLTEFSLSDQLLMSLGDEQINGVIKQQSQQAKPPTTFRTNDSENLLLNLDIDLSPVSSIHQKSVVEMEDKKVETVEPFDEISKLSREMMEQGLKGMSNSSQSKKIDKTPLSQIKKPSQEGQTPTPQQQPLLKTLPTIQPLTPQNSLADPVSLLDLDFLDKPSPSSSTSENHSLVKASSSSSSSNLNTQNTNADNPTTKSTSQAKSSRLKSSSNEEENLLLVLGSENPSLVDNNNRNTNNNDNGTASEEEIIEESSSTKTTVPPIAVNGLAGGGVGESSNFCLKNVKELDLENIDLLDDVKPIELNLNEGNSKDVSLTLTFGKFPTFPSFVNVVVVTLTNKSRSTGLLNYVFQLMPPKGLQVKLLPPACMELPPWKKTFLPPPILTQVALIVIPKSTPAVKTQIQPKIKFILSYCAEDETTLHNGDFSLPSCLVQ